MDDSRIAIVLGTRAELIKIFPVMRELSNAKIPYYFIHTGQHNLKSLCSAFEVKEPDIILTKEPEKSSKFNAKQIKAGLWIIGLIFKIRKQIKKLKKLEYVLYHGDTMTTATAAVATSRLLNPFKKYKNVHLEAGLRSFDNSEPFPEEISRKFAGFFSDILLAVSDMAELNLSKNKSKVVKIGNTILDSASIAMKIAEKEGAKPLSKKKFALVTIHRHENLKSKERMEKIIDILSDIKITTFFAIHDNTIQKLKEFGLYERLSVNPNIKLIAPMDYPSFIYQISQCSLIICDGGSMQEESLIFKKPCILLRKATERQEGLNSNFQFLSKLDVEKTKEKIKEYLSPQFRTAEFNNPYGNVGISKKILEILR
ncbi:MAG TPA: UDP-N-acetylglucosamine 2-epimerase (non-hydrolyzing) [Candidatus Omnitrophota bacterium]|nr:UDP-N-acetylglucosamine 2-epimerase (non-hydrolyzing) [Candidatus Omnitrophota bacterium]